MQETSGSLCLIAKFLHVKLKTCSQWIHYHPNHRGNTVYSVIMAMGEGLRSTNRDSSSMIQARSQYICPQTKAYSIYFQRVAIVALQWGLTSTHTSGASQCCFYIVPPWQSVREPSIFRRTSLILLNWSTEDELFCLEQPGTDDGPPLWKPQISAWMKPEQVCSCRHTINPVYPTTTTTTHK